ncbi:MAG: hypothetical protein QXP31_09565 [Pyrobaculum sp.]
MKVVEEALYLLVVSAVASMLMLTLSLLFPYDELYKIISGIESDLGYMWRYVGEV